MTAQLLAETQLVDGLSAKRLLQGLQRIYRWLLVTDSRRRVLWMSEGLSSLLDSEELKIGCDARAFVAKLPRPEQLFCLRSALRNRSHVSAVALDLPSREGGVVPAEVSVLRLETSEPGDSLLLAIARPTGPERPDDDTEAVHRALLDGAPCGVLAVDADGFVTCANRAAEQITGRAAGELVGCPAALLFGDGAKAVERLAATFERRDDDERRLPLLLPGGGHSSVLVSVSSLGRGRKGLFLREAQAGGAEAELRRANDELEHCVNSLAHDLRSPLVALLGFSRLMRQEYGALLDATGEHFLDRIEQAGRTMESLVHDMLELSRIGQPGDRPGLIDPRGVLMQLTAELKPRLDAAGIALTLPDGSLPVVYCDRTRLYQVLSNLIGNAIDHMGDTDEPRIEVTLTELERGHRITVRDNGLGIAPEVAARIFDAFQSFPRAGGRRGTGMGLAIVKKIAEKLGGRAWVESAPGEGAAFHVDLPQA